MRRRTITSSGQLADYLGRLAQSKRSCIALDIEGEYNLHQYGERFCLLQLFDGEELVIVDPFTTGEEQMQALFENRRLLKVMFDSSSDQALLQRNHGWKVNSILDLKPAVDLLDFEARDLGSVLQATLGITVEKKKKFQRYNWTRRPIDEEAIEYALGDVRYLLELKERLLERLAAQHLLDEYILKNLMVQNKEPETDHQPRLLKSIEVQRLPKEGRRRFEELYWIRDRYAKELNLPPDTVIAKRELFELSLGRLAIEQVGLNKRVPGGTREKLIAEVRRTAGKPGD